MEERIREKVHRLQQRGPLELIFPEDFFKRLDSCVDITDVKIAPEDAFPDWREPKPDLEIVLGQAKEITAQTLINLLESIFWLSYTARKCRTHIGENKIAFWFR